MPALWIRNARVIDPASRRDSVGDVFSRDGKIVPRLSAADRKRARKIDARGLVAAPGLVDIHVHFREPGQAQKETIATGSRAAAAGGFTTVVCMPNTAPAADNAGTIQFILDAVRRDSLVKVLPTGCITIGMKGETLAPIGSLKRAGAVAITDDGECVQSNELMRRAIEYAKMFGLPVMDHCQDQSMTEGAVMNEGNVSIRLGLRGWPNAAEDLIVSRNVILSRYTGAHIHLQHISSALSVEIVRRAKADGVRVTAEATPHHIALTDEALATYDTNFKMNPPLRSARDREAIQEGLADGTIEILCSDHAPHCDYEKEVEFDYAPFGITGLETELALSLMQLVHTKRISLADMIAKFTVNPARLLNLNKGTLSAGADADVTVFDPDCEWIFRREDSASKSRNSPFFGWKLKGKAAATIVAGKLVWAERNESVAV